uniref:Mannitol dehydrogenase N-terminal domain-containing protein n=1 Tax=Globisporangium ultimum (strain ATCC 200006 / CBS 805.95 / DAOM BR144) TaxID=431595 RepID=K3W5G5_GLOUD
MAAFQPLRAPAFSADTSAISIGSGRFVRAVLVPVLRAIGSKVVIAQTRGSNFVDACAKANGTYEVDIYREDGSKQTDVVEVEAVGSLGNAEGRAAFLELPGKLPALKYIGFAVTDTGIAKDSQAIKDLAEFLFQCYNTIPENVISIINTDNVPNNGDAIKRFVTEANWDGKPADTSAFTTYLNSKVHFHNTMVDRLTTQRPGDHIVPLTEPCPTKALVIEDLHGVLDAAALSAQPGVHIRTTKAQLEEDHLLKLSIANAVHTSMVYFMALLRIKETKKCLDYPEIREFLNFLFETDIVPSLAARGIPQRVAQDTYNEWMARVEYGHFSLDTFWVSQNAMFKYGVRLFSSVAANVANDPNYHPSVFMAFATAVIFRFLTPVQTDSRKETAAPIFVGEMDPIQDKTPIYSETEKTWTYGNGMTANLSTGKYEFNDGVGGRVATLLARASKDVFQASKSSSNTFTKSENAEPSSEVSAGVGVAVATALSTVSGFDLSKDVYASFAVDVAALYQRLISGKKTGSGSALDVLKDILRNQQTSEYLNTKEELAVYVRESVATVEAIDVHTHLFPPSHGKLMLWGINELLTYHYLVAEYMMTAPIEIEEFNTFSKEKQAGLIWQHLFVDRSPISEACRGVITTIQALGLGHLLAKRDLAAIQRWFALQDPEEYVDTVFRLSGLKYAVMTNIPFEPEEARHWLGDPANSIPPPKWSRKYFRSALRVDQILLGDWASIGPTLDVFQLPHTLEGCRELLVKWIDIMKPEYFMSSVPIHFEYPSDNAPPTPAGDKPTGADLLLKVLLPLAEEAKLPIALKFDSVRPINARLGVAGDGVKPCDVDILIKLCRRFPNVKFLATFLSRVNQHEVTVAANKFRNLHLYGCWWYCNNPSIIEEMTRMRIEILGTGFTSQHSDARVLDQLIYKWSHSRELIGEVLVDMYDKMFNTGWKISKSDIQRDVQRLFGLSYEEFMSK